MKPVSGEPVLLLYATEGCHLCDQAEALIRHTLGAPLTVVEIVDNPHLLDRYGVRIPVLHRSDTGQELDWPFTKDSLDCWWAV